MSDNENIEPFLKENARQPEGAGTPEGSPAEQAADWIYHHVSYLDVVSFLKARKDGNAEQLLLSLMAEKKAPEELQAAAAANAAEVSERLNQRLCDNMQSVMQSFHNFCEELQGSLNFFFEQRERLHAYLDYEYTTDTKLLNKRQRELLPFIEQVLNEWFKEYRGKHPAEPLPITVLEALQAPGKRYSEIRKAARELQKKYKETEKAAREAQKKLEDINIFFRMPSSQATDAIMSGLAANNYDDIMRREEISHGAEIIPTESDGMFRIVTFRGKYKCAVELPDIEKNNDAVNNLFIYSLIKLNEQAYSAGTLRSRYISFPLHEAVDIGMYKSIESARKGLRAAANGLTSIKATGEVRKGEDGKIVISTIQVLFTGVTIKNNECTIAINPDADWGLIAAYYTQLPIYCFELSKRGKILLLYIFCIARQRTKQLRENGKFSISIKAIAARLNLPKPEETKNPDRDIKSVIEDCITEIEDHNQNSNFTITPSTDSTVPIREYCENGYITVELKKEFLEPFKKIKQKKNKQKEI